MEEEHNEALRRNHVRLCEQLDLMEILPRLHQSRLLTLAQIQEIKKIGTEYGKNQIFLQKIPPTAEFWNIFIVSLIESSQSHLASLLESQEKKRLREHYNNFVTEIDLNGVLRILYDDNVITRLQYNEWIMRDKSIRNGDFLNHVLIFGTTEFLNKFLTALIDTNQFKFASMLNPDALPSDVEFAEILCEPDSDELLMETNQQSTVPTQDGTIEIFSSLPIVNITYSMRPEAKSVSEMRQPWRFFYNDFQFSCTVIAIVCLLSAYPGYIWITFETPALRANIAKPLEMFTGIDNQTMWSDECAQSINFNGNNENQLLCTAKRATKFFGKHGQVQTRASIIHLNSMTIEAHDIKIDFGNTNITQFPKKHNGSQVACRFARLTCSSEEGGCEKFSVCCTPYAWMLSSNDTYCLMKQPTTPMIFRLSNISYAGGLLTPYTVCPFHDYDKCLYVLDATGIEPYHNSSHTSHHRRNIRLVYDGGADPVVPTGTVLKEVNGASLLAFTFFSVAEVGFLTVNVTTGAKHIVTCNVAIEKYRPRLRNCNHYPIDINGLTASDFLLGRFMKSGDRSQTYFVAKFSNNKLLVKTTQLGSTTINLDAITKDSLSHYFRVNQLIYDQNAIVIIYCSNHDRKCGRAEIVVRFN